MFNRNHSIERKQKPREGWKANWNQIIRKLEQTEETQTESGMSMLVKKGDIKATETNNVSS